MSEQSSSSWQAVEISFKRLKSNKNTKLKIETDENYLTSSASPSKLRFGQRVICWELSSSLFIFLTAHFRHPMVFHASSFIPPCLIIFPTRYKCNVSVWRWTNACVTVRCLCLFLSWYFLRVPVTNPPPALVMSQLCISPWVYALLIIPWLWNIRVWGKHMKKHFNAWKQQNSLFFTLVKFYETETARHLSAENLFFLCSETFVSHTFFFGRSCRTCNQTINSSCEICVSV